jgi:hypothetical protein
VHSGRLGAFEAILRQMTQSCCSAHFEHDTHRFIIDVISLHWVMRLFDFAFQGKTALH